MHLGLLNQHGAMMMQGCMRRQEPKQVTLQSPLYIKVGKLWLMCKLVICGHGLTMIKQLASENSMSQDVIVCGIVVAIVCGCLYFVCLFSSFSRASFVLEFFVHYFTPMMQYHLRSCTKCSPIIGLKNLDSTSEGLLCHLTLKRQISRAFHNGS